VKFNFRSKQGVKGLNVKNALLSIDYIYKDYANTKFKPTNDGLYNYLNNTMKNVLSDNYELRLGGEYKIKQWSLRAGYRFEQSPYKNDYVMGDLSAYSGGLGYNFGGSRLDLSYTNEHRNYNQYLLTSGLNDSARIRNYNNNVTLTYVINF
jgi:long-subunit fatty acid transport protein